MSRDVSDVLTNRLYKRLLKENSVRIGFLRHDMETEIKDGTGLPSGKGFRYIDLGELYPTGLIGQRVRVLDIKEEQSS